MEVIIYSGNSDSSTKLKDITDKIIVEKRLRLMSLHTSSPSETDELKKLINPDRGYLVIVDAPNCQDWEKTVSEISSKCRGVKFCIASDNIKDAAEAINISSNIWVMS